MTDVPAMNSADPGSRSALGRVDARRGARRSSPWKRRAHGRPGSAPAASVSTEEYHPYGTTAWWTDPGSTVSQKRYRYTGKEKDEESGLYYHGARYLAPWLARWCTSDPSPMVDGGPNRYAYVKGNPIGRRDSAGRWPDLSGYLDSPAAQYVTSRLEALPLGAIDAVTGAVTSTETYKAISTGVSAVGAAASGDYAKATVAAQASARHAAAVVAGDKASTLVSSGQHVGQGISALKAGNAPLAAAHVVAANEQVQGVIADVRFEASLEGQALHAAQGAASTVKFVSYDAPVQTGTNVANFLIGDADQARSAAGSQVGVNARATLVAGTIALTIAGLPRGAPIGRLAATEAAAGAEAVAAKPPSASFGWTTSLDYRETFLAANPGLRGNVIVHHAVEQQSMTRYPGVVKPQEMHSLENLRGVPVEWNPEVHLSVVRREWNAFYKANPTATKDALLAKATEIDDLVGRWWDPPNRQ